MFPDAEKLVLVTDNRNTRTTACLYEAFDTARARRIVEHFEWHYTPKHGSWLGTAQIECAALNMQCLDRRVGSMARLRKEVAAWEEDRNEREVGLKWRLTIADDWVKLNPIYPLNQE